MPETRWQKSDCPACNAMVVSTAAIEIQFAPMIPDKKPTAIDKAEAEQEVNRALNALFYADSEQKG